MLYDTLTETWAINGAVLTPCRQGIKLMEGFHTITIVSPTHWDKYIVGIQTEHLSVAIGVRTNAL